MPELNPKEKLRELAQEIAALVDQERRLYSKKPFPPTIPFELGEWFVRATDEFLSGKEADFGKALGLKRGRGRPRPATPSGNNYERTKKIFWMRGLGSRPAKSWTEIANAFPNADVREMQRELKRYTPDIIREFSDALASRLSQSASGRK